MKAQDWDSAFDVLHGGAVALLKAGQGGSGADLGCMLVDILGKSGKPVDGAVKSGSPLSRAFPGRCWSRGGSVGYDKLMQYICRGVDKLLTVLRAFPPDEPTKKKYVTEMIQWSARTGDYPNGDPELHHAAGSLYAQGSSQPSVSDIANAAQSTKTIRLLTEAEPYEAERHLTLGTRDSPETLARLEYEWYTQDGSHTAALYCARCVFPYLLTSNLRAANKAYLIFTSRLSTSNKALMLQEVSSKTADMRVYPSLPLLNFLGLLLLAVQRGGADLYKQLAKHYAPYVKEVGGWDDALATIGEMYFGIKIPRQGNPLFDMMGSMMGFGGGSPKPKPKKVEAQMPPSEGLD